MSEIHPAILAHSENEFMTKVKKVRALGAPLHIDVMDGIFVQNTTWAPPERMQELLAGIVFEAHLMVANPEYVIPVWLAAGARRVIFHEETTTQAASICRDNDRVSVALNPETPISHLSNECAHVCIMGVTPGWSGQPFQEIALEKIREIKKMYPAAHITVDGGARSENIRAIVDAGADVVVVGSAITDADDPAAVYQSFKEMLK